MYKRFATPIIEKFATLYPIVGITGPRQSGKTTLVRSIFKHLPYVSLENLDTRVQAQNDPRGFLKTYEQGAILDEVQNVPELMSYLQNVVDDSPVKGRYVLTGSQNFTLSSCISQSLAGRIGLTTLLPLSLSELNSYKDKDEAIFKGGYPGLYQLNMVPTDFYPSYIQTYLERDIRQLKNIENLNKFQLLLKLCAGRIGQILNLTSLAQDCGISHTTVRQWLSILEASYIIFFLQPYYKNFSKRLIKMPKLYFYDTGLACNLLTLESVQQLNTHYLKGGLFENLIILELLKNRFNKGLPPNLYFWRESNGHEVDCIAEWGGQLKAFEIKSGATFHPEFVKNLVYFKEVISLQDSYLVYSGTEKNIYNEVKVLPVKDLEKSYAD